MATKYSKLSDANLIAVITRLQVDEMQHRENVRHAEIELCMRASEIHGLKLFQVVEVERERGLPSFFAVVVRFIAYADGGNHRVTLVVAPVDCYGALVNSCVEIPLGTPKERRWQPATHPFFQVK